MLSAALGPALLGFYALAASATFVHFRGKVRLRFGRQLTDLSTFTAPYNALMYLFSAVPTTPILDVEDFPALRQLRENWQTIRDEALALLTAERIRAAPRHDDIAFNTFFKRGWKRFYLKWYDDVMPSAVATCPKTVALIEAIPEVNAAMFAFMPARSKLGKHRDPFAGSLRYHLGLATPNSDACRIYVDGAEYAWRDGQDVLFDETFIHRAENATDESRLILFCDVTRPLRTPVARALNRMMIDHVVRATATQNDEQDRLGVVNRVSSFVHRISGWTKRVKRTNRPLYTMGKYSLIAALVYVLFLRGLLGG